jgi:hypothetical protein
MARHGMARPGPARQGRHGQARHDKERRGEARQAWPGKAGQGPARRGKAWEVKTLKQKRYKMSNSKMQQIKKELEIIREQNGGKLSPEAVVKYAENKKTALHEKFIWDNTEAAKKYRLLQAGQVIRSVTVTVLENEKTNRRIHVRAYASLPCDRSSDTGSYRHIKEVISEDQLRIQYIDSINDDIAALREKLKKVSIMAAKKLDAVQKAVNDEKRKIQSKRTAIA